MKLYGIHTNLIRANDDLTETILTKISEHGLEIEDGDVLAIASKALAVAQNQLKRLDSIKPSEKARKLARKYDLEPSFVEIVLQEADAIYGGVSKALLTLKEHILTANAGVDHKNAPHGFVTLWPKNPFRTAESIKKAVFDETGKHVGVLIVDSRVTPLRMGTTGLALAAAGFEPVRDLRTGRDLYGNPILITRHSVADDLASAAHLVMGESNEQTPIVLIKNAPVTPTEHADPSSMLIAPEQCLYAKHIMKRRL